MLYKDNVERGRIAQSFMAICEASRMALRDCFGVSASGSTINSKRAGIPLVLALSKAAGKASVSEKHVPQMRHKLEQEPTKSGFFK